MSLWPPLTQAVECNHTMAATGDRASHKMAATRPRGNHKMSINQEALLNRMSFKMSIVFKNIFLLAFSLLDLQCPFKNLAG